MAIVTCCVNWYDICHIIKQFIQQKQVVPHPHQKKSVGGRDLSYPAKKPLPVKNRTGKLEKT